MDTNEQTIDLDQPKIEQPAQKNEQPATTTSGSIAERLNHVRSFAKERESFDATGVVASIVFYTQSASQVEKGICNGQLSLKVDGVDNPVPVRFTADVALIGSTAAPKIGVGDTAILSIKENASEYGYNARLSSYQKALSLAQQQQMALIAKLGIQLNIAVS